MYTYGLQEAKGKIPSRKQASANEHEFASLLLWAGLVEVRELGLFVVLDLLVALVHLVVLGQGYVGGFEVLARLVFHPVVGCNPVEELGEVFLVLCVGRLVLFLGYVVSGRLIQCGLAAIARQILCEIVATSESSCIENGAKSHNGDRCHGCVVGRGLYTRVYKLNGLQT